MNAAPEVNPRSQQIQTVNAIDPKTGGIPTTKLAPATSRAPGNAMAEGAHVSRRRRNSAIKSAIPAVMMTSMRNNSTEKISVRSG